MEIFKTIGEYKIYIGGTWCEVTNKDGHVFDGSVEEGTIAEEVYNYIVNRIEG